MVKAAQRHLYLRIPNNRTIHVRRLFKCRSEPQGPVLKYNKKLDCWTNESVDCWLLCCNKHPPHSSSLLITSYTVATRCPLHDLCAQDMTFMCVALLHGVAWASKIANLDHVPEALTPLLPHLYGIMCFYAGNISVCKSLLTFFQGYARNVKAAKKKMMT